MRRLLPILLLALLAVGLSCGDSEPSGPPDPIPGWLRIRFTSPNTDDGGVLFTISGGTVTSVRSPYPDLFVTPSGTLPLRVLVAGNLASGVVVAEIQVPDVQTATDYTVVVEEVASRDTFEQREVSTYSLVVEQ